MPVTFYVKDQVDLVNDPQYQEIISVLPTVANRMMKNGFEELEVLPGYKVGRLRGDTDRIILKLRDNKTTRLIFTYFNYRGENHPLILEIDELHDLDSKYQKKGVLDAFFEKHEASYHAIIDKRIQERDAEAMLAREHQNNDRIPVTIIGANVIMLDEEQKNIKAPAIVEGAAGSGKTCVGYDMLVDYVRAHSDTLEGKKILYVTKLPRLVESIRKFWNESPYKPEAQEPLHILTYEELLRSISPDREVAQNGKAIFDAWYKEHVEAKIKGKSKAGTQLTAEDRDNVWSEFRARCLNDLTEENRGAKRTTIPQEKQAQLANEYKAWLDYCKENQLHFAEFFQIGDLDDAACFDMVFVDETQDMSMPEIQACLRVARNHQIVYALDPRQDMHDAQSKTVAIKQMFHDANFDMGSVNVVQLQRTYRCKPQVMKLAKAINDYRIRKTPDEKKKEAPINIIEAGAPGEVIWLESENDIAQMAKNASVVIMTTADEKKRLLKERKWTQVFTPEEIKGLQYETVVLYNILSDEVYRVINNSTDRSWNYATPLNKLFTAITRSEDSVYIYQTNPRRVNEIIEIMRPFFANAASDAEKAKATHQSTADEWYRQAEEVVKESQDAAVRILMNELKLTQEETDTWLRQRGYSRAPETRPVVTLGRKQLKGRMNTAKKLLRSGDKRQTLQGMNILTEDLNIKDEDLARWLMENNFLPNNVCDGSNEDLATDVIMGLRDNVDKGKHSELDKAICTSDFTLLRKLLENDKGLNWNYETDQGVRAIDVIVRIDTKDAAPLLKILILKRSFDVNAKSTSAKQTCFAQAFFDGRNAVVEVFLKSDRFVLDSHFIDVEPSVVGVSIKKFACRNFLAPTSPLIPLPFLDYIKKNHAKHALDYAYSIAKYYYKDPVLRKTIETVLINILHAKHSKVLREKPNSTHAKIYPLVKQLVEIAFQADVPDAYFHKAMIVQSEKMDQAYNNANASVEVDEFLSLMEMARSKGVEHAGAFIDQIEQDLLLEDLSKASDRVASVKVMQRDLHTILKTSDFDALINFANYPDDQTAGIDWNIMSQGNQMSVLGLLVARRSDKKYSVAEKLVKSGKVSVNPLPGAKVTPLNLSMGIKDWDFAHLLIDTDNIDLNAHLLSFGDARAFFDRLVNYLVHHYLNNRKQGSQNARDFLKEKNPGILLNVISGILVNMGFGIKVENSDFYDIFEKQARERMMSIPDCNALLGVVVEYIDVAANAGVPLALYHQGCIILNVCRSDRARSAKIQLLEMASSYLESAQNSGVKGSKEKLCIASKQLEALRAIKLSPEEEFIKLIRDMDIESLFAFTNIEPARVKDLPWGVVDPESGMTLLMMVCKTPHDLGLPVMRFLLNQDKVNANLFDKAGNNAFVYAGIIQSTKPDYMKHLLVFGALDYDSLPIAEHQNSYKKKRLRIYTNLINPNPSLKSIIERHRKIQMCSDERTIMPSENAAGSSSGKIRM